MGYSLPGFSVHGIFPSNIPESVGLKQNKNYVIFNFLIILDGKAFTGRYSGNNSKLTTIYFLIPYNKNVINKPRIQIMFRK